MARSGDAMDVDAFTKGSKGASKGSVLVLREDRSLSFRMSEETWTVERFQERRQQREQQQQGVQRQMLQVWQDWSHVEGLHIQRNECIRSRNGMHRNGKHRLECIGDRSSAEEDHRIRIGIDSCAAVLVCCGRLPDARHARHAEELQTSVGQDSTTFGCAKGASHAQGRVSQVREPENYGCTHRALMAFRNKRHGTRCLLLLHERQKHQSVTMRTTRAVARKWNLRE